MRFQGVGLACAGGGGQFCREGFSILSNQFYPLPPNQKPLPDPPPHRVVLSACT